MKTLTKTFAVALTLGALGTAAFAAGEMDANGDGILTYDEVVAAYPEMTEETFIKIDANGDGGIDEAEFVAGQDAELLPKSDG